MSRFSTQLIVGLVSLTTGCALALGLEDKSRLKDPQDASNGSSDAVVEEEGGVATCPRCGSGSRPCCAPLQCGGDSRCCEPRVDEDCSSSTGCCSPLVCNAKEKCAASCLDVGATCAKQEDCCFRAFCGTTHSCEACRSTGAACSEDYECCGGNCRSNLCSNDD